MTWQKLFIVGNLGKAPELRYAPDGKAVTQLNVAVNNTYKKDGETVKDTTWFRVSVWGAAAESANQYLKSGSQVLIDGELVADKETGGPKVFTRNDGTSGASYEVRAGRVVFLSKAVSDDEEVLPEGGDESFPFNEPSISYAEKI